MHKAEDILAQIRQLDPAERRRLLDSLESVEAIDDERTALGKHSYTHTITASGTGHSDFTDVSSDKYKHLADTYADNHDDAE